MTLFFAVIGLLFGGARGLLIGAALGFVLSRVVPALLKRGIGRIQIQFIDSTFAVVGALCKADGVVTRDEIQFAEGLFDRFNLQGVQREHAKEAFRRGKEPDFDLDAEVDRFAQAARGAHALIQMFLRVQLMAVAADGHVHEAEREMLLRIARRLGLSELELAQLAAMLRAVESGASSSWARGEAGSPRPATRQTVDDAYSTLGVDRNASDAELKRVYYTLIRDNHPDRLAAKGLPESMRQLAEERTREINAAYDVIKKARAGS